jgi:hypothetical protein
MTYAREYFVMMGRAFKDALLDHLPACAAAIAHIRPLRAPVLSCSDEHLMRAVLHHPSPRRTTPCKSQDVT